MDVRDLGTTNPLQSSCVARLVEFFSSFSVPVCGPANCRWRGSRCGGLWTAGPRAGSGAASGEPSPRSWAFLSSCSGWRSLGRRYWAAKAEPWPEEGLLQTSSTGRRFCSFCWKLCSGCWNYFIILIGIPSYWAVWSGGICGWISAVTE